MKTKTKSQKFTFTVTATVAPDVKVTDVKFGIEDTLNRYRKAANVESVRVSRPRARPKMAKSALRLMA